MRALVSWAALLLVFCACPRDASPPPREPAAERPALESERRDIPPAIPVPVELPSAPGEAGVRAFVTAFLDARRQGNEPRARDFLSPSALDQFSKAEGGLALTGVTAWELEGLNAADASSYEVRVRLAQAGRSLEEVLFVGPGPDTSGAERAWIVRGAMRP